MDMQLKDRVALVTGGTRDVGREIALTLAAEGAAVAVHHRSSTDDAEAVVSEIRKQGGKAKAYQADIAQDAQGLLQFARSIVVEPCRLHVLLSLIRFSAVRTLAPATETAWPARPLHSA